MFFNQTYQCAHSQSIYLLVPQTLAEPDPINHPNDSVLVEEGLGPFLDENCTSWQLTRVLFKLFLQSIAMRNLLRAFRSRSAQAELSGLKLELLSFHICA
ncbi:hypothetical protein MRB53_037973 [Persea americana]|nr:hypothetical protein MRB53_037973 [Persea americana]